MDYQNFQDHIRQLKTWDDPALLTKPPLQDLFTCWGVANPTRSGGKKIMEDLVRELASQGNQVSILFYTWICISPADNDTNRQIFSLGWISPSILIPVLKIRIKSSLTLVCCHSLSKFNGSCSVIKIQRSY